MDEERTPDETSDTPDATALPPWPATGGDEARDDVTPENVTAENVTDELTSDHLATDEGVTGDRSADDGPTDTPPTAETTNGPGAPRRLRRDMEKRMLGGVAAGVARYLDIDVIIVRIAFAVLTVFGGSGALIYVTAWLLVPADDEEHPLAHTWAARRPPRRSMIMIIIGVVVGVIAISDLFSSGPWWPHRDGGISLGFGAVALILALILVAGSGGSRTAVSRLRWFSLMLVLAAVAVLVVAAATVFSIEAASGVPLRGGIGDTQWHPTAASEVASNYRLAVGNLNVDLSDVPFRTGTTHVTASVGVGRLIVEVPPGPTVTVVAHSGLGDVEVFGQSNGGLSTVQSVQSGATGSRTRLVLDADAGVGQVQVVRTSSAFS
jgi:phage shock protein PspC (stress-responsive transcriptional regulator)